MIDVDELIRRRRAGQHINVGSEVIAMHARAKRELSSGIAVGVPVSPFDAAGEFGARREFGDPLPVKETKKKKRRRTKAEKKGAEKKAEKLRAKEAKKATVKKEKRKTKREMKREKMQ